MKAFFNFNYVSFIFICYLVKSAEPCNRSFTSPTGTISHLNYRDNQRCTWYIEAPKDSIIQLTFKQFATEKKFDVVAVYHKLQPQRPGDKLIFVKEYSGNYNREFTLQLSNWVKIQFRSDGSNTAKGFYATYSTENRTPHLLTVNSTNPIALHYKNSNNRSFSWIWRLSNADPTGFLTLHVEATNVDKEGVINIHDGSSSQDKQIARISSGNTNASYFSTSKDLWISANLKNGTLSVIVTSGCRTNLNDEKGFIVSPSYPGKYNTRMKCVWTIKPPISSTLSFIYHPLPKYSHMSTYFNTVVRPNTSNISGKFIVKDNKNKVMGEFPGNANGSRLSSVSTGGEALSIMFYPDDKDRRVSHELDHISSFETAGFKISYSVDCTPITNITGGSVIGNNFYGSVIQYVCNKGFYLVNGRQQSCQFGGVWSYPTPHCEEWILPTINASHEGYVIIGTEITIECSSNNGLVSSRLFLVNGADIRIGNSRHVHLDNVQPIASNSYRCKEITGDQVFYSRWVAINVTWLANPQLSVTDESIAAESNIQFNCNVDGFSEITYQWFKDNELLAAASEKTYVIDRIRMSEAGSYQCNVTNAFGSKTSQSIYILVWSLGDVLVSSSSDDNVRIGSNVTLSCKITGNAVGTRFQWIDGSQKVVSNSSVFKINDIQRNESGKYSCKAAKENIVKMSGVVHITVTWLETPVLAFQKNKSVAATFTNLKMMCLAKGHPNVVRYIWYKDNVQIKSTLVPSMQLSIISTAFSGNYRCKAINEFWERLSDYKRLDVWDLKVPKTISSHEGSVAMGTDINMTCSTTDDKQVTSLTWESDTGKVINESSTLQLVGVTKIHSGRYRCKAEREGVAVYSRFIKIKVTYLKKPSLQFLPLGTIKRGGTVILICRSDGTIPITYEIVKDGMVTEIIPNEGTSLVITYENVRKTHAGNYTCTASNDDGKEVSNILPLKVNG